MDGLAAIVAKDFELGVIQEKPAIQLLDLSKHHDLLPRRDDLLDEGHVEPATVDLSRAENAARAIHHHGLVEPPSRSRIPHRSVHHHTVEADGLGGTVGGKGIEAPPVFMALWEMRKHRGRVGKAAGSEGEHFPRGKERHGGQGGSGGDHLSFLRFPLIYSDGNLASFWR